MASIFSETPTYLTADEVKASTNISELKTKSTLQVNRLILEAQRVVDNFIGSFWTKLDSTQKTIFPNLDDWTESFEAGIPQDIKEATLYIVEALSVYGNQMNTAGNQVVQETVGDHTVKYSEAESVKSINDLIPLKASDILKQYWSQFLWQTLHQNNVQDVQAVFTTQL